MHFKNSENLFASDKFWHSDGRGDIRFYIVCESQDETHK